MANIQRYGYGGMLDDVFGDLMKGFWVKPVAVPGDGELKMKVDVSEDDKTYTIHADIPGVKKEDIHVDVDGGQVSIRAEVKHENVKWRYSALWPRVGPTRRLPISSLLPLEPSRHMQPVSIASWMLPTVQRLSRVLANWASCHETLHLEIDV